MTLPCRLIKVAGTRKFTTAGSRLSRCRLPRRRSLTWTMPAPAQNTDSTITVASQNSRFCQNATMGSTPPAPSQMPSSVWNGLPSAQPSRRAAR